jgi:pimeloyl-ACP methyl ester carboxylesterase
MAEEILKRNLDQAFDPGPDFPSRLLLSRTMAVIAEDAARPTKVRHRLRVRLVTAPSLRLMAAALVLLLTVAAVGALLILHQHTKTTSLVWSGCGGGFECATASVPIDYSNRDGGTTSIAVIRKPAIEPTARIGPLFLSPGLGSGVAFVRQNAGSFKDLNTRFDLVGFDSRGTLCLSASQRDYQNALDPVLDDPGEKQAFERAAQAFAQGCRQRDGALLPFVDTTSIAWDMDEIRSAIGDPKLTYLGTAGGSLLGQMYAHLFPTHVRAMALDGLVDPNLSGSDSLRQQAAAYDANLQAFLGYCRSFVGCQLAHSGDPAVLFAHLMQQLDITPLQVGKRMLTRGLAVTAIEGDLADPRYWNSLDEALNNALIGDGQFLLTTADLVNGRQANGTYKIAGGEPLATLCLDWLLPANLAVYDQLGPTFATASPFFGPALQYFGLPCAYWPVKAKRTPGPLTAAGAPPMLLVAATGDPFTPYSWAQAVSNELSTSVLLTRAGYGQGSYPKSLCIRERVDGYLTNLALPAPGMICESDYVP